MYCTAWGCDNVMLCAKQNITFFFVVVQSRVLLSALNMTSLIQVFSDTVSPEVPEHFPSQVC